MIPLTYRSSGHVVKKVKNSTDLTGNSYLKFTPKRKMFTVVSFDIIQVLTNTPDCTSKCLRSRIYFFHDFIIKIKKVINHFLQKVATLFMEINECL